MIPIWTWLILLEVFQDHGSDGKIDKIKMLQETCGSLKVTNLKNIKHAEKLPIPTPWLSDASNLRELL